MKKRILRLPSGSTLILSVLLFCAIAITPVARTQNLNIGGQGLPRSCQLTLGDGGIADYGTIPAASLVRGQYTALASKLVTLRISCPGQTTVGLSVADNRADSLIAELGEARYNFGLGKTGDANVGGYSLYLEQSGVTTDLQPANQIFSNNGRESWEKTGTGGQLGKDRLFAWARPNTTVPAPFATINGSILIIPRLNKPELLPLSQQIPLDGSVTVEIQYL